MKQLFVMLLLVSSAITTVQAQKKIYPNMPQRVINKLNHLINLEGDKERQTYSVTKNPTPTSSSRVSASCISPPMSVTPHWKSSPRTS